MARRGRGGTALLLVALSLLAEAARGSAVDDLKEAALKGRVDRIADALGAPPGSASFFV